MDNYTTRRLSRGRAAGPETYLKQSDCNSAPARGDGGSVWGRLKWPTSSFQFQ